MGKLDGKTALVTGGGRGIGRGIALELAREGADVAVNYRRDAAAAEDTVREIVEGKHDDLPEQAFYMVGTIDEAIEKARKLAA